MVVLSLPLSFTNSFWTPDYRKGLQVLFAKLEEGVAENDEIVAFIKDRAVAESQIATTLINPAPIGVSGTGFGADDGASLLMAFRGLQAESKIQGEAHKAIAKELNTLVADPFNEWAQGYKERLRQNKATVIDNWLRSYEISQGEVERLKAQYLNKTRKADEAEDDAKFAPNSDYDRDKYTSPRLAPHDTHRTPPQRTASVSERIANRLKEIQQKSVSTLAAREGPPKSDETVFEVHSEGEKSPTPTGTPKAIPVDKGKGKAVEEPELNLTSSPPPMSPGLPPPNLSVEPTKVAPAVPVQPILLAGLAFTPSSLSALLTRASKELHLRPIRFPLLGEYQDCFNGEEFVAWLNTNVDGFGGNLDKAEEAARELTERENLLRRIGELGNPFEHSDDAFYQFRARAFDIVGKASDPASTVSPAQNLAPMAGNLIRRSNTFVNVVAKVLNANAHSEPAHIRARAEAEEADYIYRVAIRKLDRQRLSLEERVEETLKILQRWEAERLRAVKTVLLQYQGTLANGPKGLEASNERSTTLIASYQPDSDLKALIERYRTGPFHPSPQVYESIAHDELDVLFGVDLRKWAEGGWNEISTGEEKKELYPNVLSALLTRVQEAYSKLPDTEKRKAWIYEIPLGAVHHLREALNASGPEKPIPAELLAAYDAPIVAGAIRLWLLELNPPIALWEGWEEMRKLYPTVGSVAAEGGASEEQRIQDLSAALQKLPRVHLYVLDALISHFKTLIDSTTVEEDNEVYLTKLALSVGRTIIRPKSETVISLHDRHPTLLFIDLVKNYAAIIPPTIARKKRESARTIPIRKRTAPVDMRMVRGKISVGPPTREIRTAQQAEQKVTAAVPSVPKVPPPPATVMGAPPAVPPPPPPLAKPKTPPPPPASVVAPPPVVVPPPPPPSVPAPKTANLDEPMRPSFKEPPPEDEDLPPRPSFKEPPPEQDDYVTPPMPKFVDPPVSPPSTPPPPAAPEVIPPTPQSKPTPVPVKRNSLITQSNSPSPSSIRAQSRSPSPPNDESFGKSSLSRSGSAQGAYIRGPRPSRGARSPGQSNVSSMVSNFNRNSIGNAPGTQPSYKRNSGGSPSRPQIMAGAAAQDSRARGIGRTQALSRRTMASDAEDEVVQ